MRQAQSPQPRYDHALMALRLAYQACCVTKAPDAIRLEAWKRLSEYVDEMNKGMN